MTTMYARPSHRRVWPLMARVHYPREMQTWGLLALTMGAVEGGLTGVLVKNVFAGAVDNTWLNLAVALVAGAPAFSHILSFLFAALSQGRAKIALISRLQAVTGLCLLPVAFAPQSAFGLWLAVISIVTARVVWSGVVTVRSVVWRANYPRQFRADITGRLAALTSLVMALTAALVGLLLEFRIDSYRWLYPALGLMAVVGALRFRGLKMRQQGAYLRAERDAPAGLGVSSMWAVMRDDPAYRRYMLTMFVFGSGNLMVMAPLIVIMNEQMDVTRWIQVAVSSALPLLVIPWFVPFWARVMGNGHVIAFRARHSWVFVATLATWAAAGIAGLPWLLWLGGFLQGLAYSGGLLGWNLGHNDFAGNHRAGVYMGLHMTLTGLRGLVMPLLGVAIYQWLELSGPGQGRWVLLLPLSLTTAGALLFFWQSRRLGGDAA